MNFRDIVDGLTTNFLRGVNQLVAPQGQTAEVDVIISGMGKDPTIGFPSKHVEIEYFKYLTAQWALFRLTGLALLGGEKLFFGLEPPPVADPENMLAQRYAVLLQKDLHNVLNGLYPWEILTFPYRESLLAVPEFVSDFNAIRDRMNRNEWLVPNASAYPQYYRRTYHWQSDGYLSDRSARLYDVSAELQLRGAANGVRRLAVGHVLKNLSKEVSQPRLLELGCGTGRLLRQISRALPKGQFVGVDLSPYYVEAARRELSTASNCSVLCGNAYKLVETGLVGESESFDAIVSVFLLHELPAVLRRRLFSECYELLKPGGVVVFGDAVQDSDDSFMSGYLRWLLARFHEPYFFQYLVAPIVEELQSVGFSVDEPETAFLAKYFVARKAR